VQIGLTIFFVIKIHHFVNKKFPRNMVNGTFWKKFKTLMKLLRFLENLGIFLAFFFLNHHI